MELPYKWREEKDYQYLNSRPTRHRWAWEFLRRNKKYQEDWCTVARRYLNEKSDTDSKFLDFTPLNYTEVIHDKSSLEKWSLSYYINPLKDRFRFKFATDEMGFFRNHGRIFHSIGIKKSRESYDYVEIELPNYDIHKMAIGVFDLTLPLRPQILSIGKAIENVQLALIEHHPRVGQKETISFKKYIRHLDALEDPTASPEEIKSKLYSTGTTTCGVGESKAISLRDGGYRILI